MNKYQVQAHQLELEEHSMSFSNVDLKHLLFQHRFG